MLAVVSESFDRWPAFPLRTTQLEHLRWKLESSETHVVLLVDDELVGVSCSWNSDAKVGTAVLPVYNGADMAIAPRFQGRGLGSRLEATWDSGESRNYLTIDAIASSAAARHLYPIDGPVIAAEAWSRPIGVRRTLGSLAVGAGRRSFGRHIARRLPGSVGTAPHLKVRAVTRFGAEVDELWEQASTAFDVLWVRRAAWLNWRYLDVRSGIISVWGAWSEGTLLGYLAVRGPNDNGVAKLLDIFAVPERPDVLAALLERAIHQARSEKAVRIDAWLAPGHPYAAALQRARFFDTGVDQPVHFDLSKLEETPEAATILSEPGTSFHIALGDFDWA